MEYFQTLLWKQQNSLLESLFLQVKEAILEKIQWYLVCAIPKGIWGFWFSQGESRNFMLGQELWLQHTSKGSE